MLPLPPGDIIRDYAAVERGMWWKDWMDMRNMRSGCGQFDRSLHGRPVIILILL
jgi:hypothetical protein